MTLKVASDDALKLTRGGGAAAFALAVERRRKTDTHGKFNARLQQQVSVNAPPDSPTITSQNFRTRWREELFEDERIRKNQEAATKRGELQGLDLDKPPPAWESFKARAQYATYTKIHEGRKVFYVNSTVATPRNIPLEELQMTVDHFYRFKEHERQRRLKLQLPNLSMEQYLFLFMKSKFTSGKAFGTRTQLTFEALEKFSDRDSKVYVFCKLLQNLVPDSLVEFLEFLKATVDSLLADYMRAQSSQSGESHNFTKQWEQATTSGIPLEFASHVVKLLYQPKDAESLVKHFKKAIAANVAHPEGHHGRRPVASHCLHYDELVDIIVIFQCRRAEDYLMKLSSLFAKVEDHGLIDRHSMFDILDSLVSESKCRQKSLMDVAKHAVMNDLRDCGDGPFTFSDCAELMQPIVSLYWSEHGPSHRQKGRMLPRS